MACFRSANSSVTSFSTSSSSSSRRGGRGSVAGAAVDSGAAVVWNNISLELRPRRRVEREVAGRSSAASRTNTCTQTAHSRQQDQHLHTDCTEPRHCAVVLAAAAGERKRRKTNKTGLRTIKCGGVRCGRRLGAAAVMTTCRRLHKLRTPAKVHLITNILVIISRLAEQCRKYSTHKEI